MIKKLLERLRGLILWIQYLQNRNSKRNGKKAMKSYITGNKSLEEESNFLTLDVQYYLLKTMEEPSQSGGAHPSLH